MERDDVTGHVGSTREEILAKREIRKKDFTKKLMELKQQWADHESGEMRLREGSETERLQKKIKAYEKKLEYLNQPPDDRVSGWSVRVVVMCMCEEGIQSKGHQKSKSFF